jgi:erythromycin esterase
MGCRERCLRGGGLFLLIASLFGYGLVARADSEEVVTWIGENAICLSTTSPSDDLTDLEPLRELIGDARIVGLGEQTHGTREFTTMKHRIIRFLVQEMGFTGVALEASLGGGLLADLYVQGEGGRLGAVKTSLEQFFFGSESFGRLLTWMRTYNETAESPVRVVGVDLSSVHKVLEWFLDVLPDDHPVNPSIVRDIRRQLPAKSRLSLSSDEKDRLEYIEFLDGFVEQIVSLSSELAGVLDPWAMAAVRCMPRAVELLRGTDDLTSTRMNSAGWWVLESWNYRDAGMAENVAWWLDTLGPNAKIIVWAHNGHIAKQWPEADITPMGERLASQFGESYVSVGFSTCEGTFTSLDPGSPGVGTLPIPAPEPGSYDDALCAAGVGEFLLDLRTLPSSTSVWNWMSASRGFKTLGASPDVVDGQVASAYDIDATLPAMFDLIVHIPRTHAARINW